MLPEQLVTYRLVLRPLSLADITALIPLIGDWAVARWLPRVPYPYTETEAAAWLEHVREAHAAGRELDFGIFEPAGGRLLGGVGLNLETGELGYWIGRPYWGRGYAGEAARAMVDTAFAPLGRPAVHAVTALDNHASGRVLVKAGLVYQGVANYDFGLRGGVRPGHLYRMTKEEWNAKNG